MALDYEDEDTANRRRLWVARMQAEIKGKPRPLLQPWEVTMRSMMQQAMDNRVEAYKKELAAEESVRYRIELERANRAGKIAAVLFILAALVAAVALDRTMKTRTPVDLEPLDAPAPALPSKMTTPSWKPPAYIPEWEPEPGATLPEKL